ncbi:MAG TPA: hypothetical protein VLQ93_20820, partial [Myxococcaceae bacterium]|nr:hypothetical protein [Myxococcaceae bacterium]
MALLLAVASCATDGELRREQEPASAAAEADCESAAGSSWVVLEAGGRQVVLPALHQRAPVQLS